MESALRKKFNDREDVYLFIALLLIGFAAILALKFIVRADQVVVTIVPCALLVVYIGYVWFTKRYLLNGDRAGDSVYYLGFLYTLLSLGLSLAQFVWAGMSARDIVGNLGIALFTTIVGLAGRVVLTQLRVDPVATEQHARLALAQATTEVRTELAQMVEDVNIFRRVTVQVISEGSQEVAKETQKALQENVAAFTSSAKAVIERIEEVFADFGSNAKKLNEASSGTIHALEKLIERVEAIDAPQNLISAKFDPLAERIGEVFTKFNTEADAQRAAVDRLRQAFETSTERVGGSMEKIGAISTSVKALVDGIDAQAKTMAANADAVRGLAEQVKATLTDAASQQTAATSRLISGFEDGLKQVSGTTGEALNELVTTQRKAAEAMAASLKLAVEGVESALMALRASSENLSDQARQHAETAVRQLQERLADIGKGAQEAIDVQTGKIEEIAKSLTEAASKVDTAASAAAAVASQQGGDDLKREPAVAGAG